MRSPIRLALVLVVSRFSKKRTFLFSLAAFVIVGCVTTLLLWELETSRLQSLVISRYAADIDHWLAAGANPALRYAEPGPFDSRAGYSALPDILPRLEQNGFTIAAQARVSARFEEALDDGLFPIYPEKSQTGLEILDRDGRTIFAHTYPERILPDFESIPPLLIRSLLYIENRELLDVERPYRNPAVEWDRLGMAVLGLGQRSLHDGGAVSGASTLATQLEKFRHSPSGLTQTPAEKFRQMASASVRAYRDGRTTLGAQRRIVLDYLNGLPLAAMPSHGEINGLVDGLRLLYGIDIDELALLREPVSREQLQRAAYVYRAALSLLLATRRPAFYLGRSAGNEELTRLSEAYSVRLEQQGVVSDALGRAVRETRLVRRHEAPVAPRVSFVEKKAANAIRANLMSLLGISRLYQLDRLDLAVSTSIDDAVQGNVSRALRELQNPDRRAAAGLTGAQLLPAGGALPITYSVLLCEATAEGNFVRIQTDSLDGPRDVNRHTKLEVGSTAKLRTLVSYLEIVESLYGQLSTAPPETMATYVQQFPDPLTQWMGGLLEQERSLSLEDALAAALARRYSANPTERFFTGGGLHKFSNFDEAFDTSMPTVAEGFRHSINLVFIRLMRDIVRYHQERIPFARDLIADPHHPFRTDYLVRFADQEGELFMRRFYGRHVGLTPTESVNRILGTRASSSLRAGRVYLAVLPDASVSDFGAFLTARFGEAPRQQEELEALYRRALPDRLSLPDLAFLAGAHPLELSVARYLALYPGVSLSETIRAGADLRQEAYRWLFRTHRKGLQDRRIRIVLEVDSFATIHDSWRRLGYPFPSLVPSYATAIGSSGDSPEALAVLVGILVNEGTRRPFTHITALRFAEHTPFETHLEHEPRGGTRVLSRAVAQAVKSALADVITNGTGRRLRDVFLAIDGTPLQIGGKTGTGDNQHVNVNIRGERIGSHARNRTATLVFFVENYFGIVTAHVEGAEAGDFAFTSALPAQIVRHLAPLLEPLFQREQAIAPPVSAVLHGDEDGACADCRSTGSLLTTCSAVYIETLSNQPCRRNLSA